MKLEEQVCILSHEKSKADARRCEEETELSKKKEDLHMSQEKADVLVSEKNAAAEELRRLKIELNTERNGAEQRVLDGLLAEEELQGQFTQAQCGEAAEEELRQTLLKCDCVVKEARKVEAEKAKSQQEANESAGKVVQLEDELKKLEEVATEKAQQQVPFNPIVPSMEPRMTIRFLTESVTLLLVMQAEILHLSTSLDTEIVEKRAIAAKLKVLREQLSVEKTAKEEALQNAAAKSDELRQLKNRLQDLVGNIQVICIARPLLPGEFGGFHGPNATIKIPEENDRQEIFLTRGQESKKYRFDKVFGPDSTHKDVFGAVEQMVASSLDGFRVCIFSYGQTGSGKTHSMMGTMAGDGQGITPRAVELLFKTKEDLEGEGWKIKIKAARAPRPSAPTIQSEQSALRGEGRDSRHVRHLGGAPEDDRGALSREAPRAGGRRFLVTCGPVVVQELPTQASPSHTVAHRGQPADPIQPDSLDHLGAFGIHTVD